MRKAKCQEKKLQKKRGRKIKREGYYHLQRPHSSYPHLKLPLHPLHLVQLYSLPPAPSRRFSPEQQQLLCHTNRIAVGEVAPTNIGPQTGERQAADNGFVRLAGPVTPAIVIVKASGENAPGKGVRLDKVVLKCYNEYNRGKLYGEELEMQKRFQHTLPSTSQSDAVPLCPSPRSFSGPRRSHPGLIAPFLPRASLRSFPAARFRLWVVWRKNPSLPVIQ